MTTDSFNYLPTLLSNVMTTVSLLIMKPDCHLVESSSALRKTIPHLSLSLLTTVVKDLPESHLVLEMSESSVMQVMDISTLGTEDQETLHKSDSPSELPMLVELCLVSLVVQRHLHLHQLLVLVSSDLVVLQVSRLLKTTLELAHIVLVSVLLVSLGMVLVVLPHSILLMLVLERQISTELLRHQEQETLLVLVPSSHLLVLQNPAPRSKRRLPLQVCWYCSNTKSKRLCWFWFPIYLRQQDRDYLYSRVLDWTIQSHWQCSPQSNSILRWYWCLLCIHWCCGSICCNSTNFWTIQSSRFCGRSNCSCTRNRIWFSIHLCQQDRNLLCSRKTTRYSVQDRWCCIYWILSHRIRWWSIQPQTEETWS